MANLLRDLPCDKVKRAVIINGRLLTHNGHLVVVHQKRRTSYRDAYNKEFEEVMPGGKYVSVDGFKLLEEYGAEFNKRFEYMSQGISDAELWEFTAKEDSYTNAIVLKSKLYNRMLDKGDTNHLHDGTVKFKQPVETAIKAFNIDLITNYFEIYSYILNRKLMSAHSLAEIKGRLVSGLFQPIVVGTNRIDCPLNLPEFAWFLSYLEKPYSITTRILDKDGVNYKGLDLTVTSMYDFSQRFNTICIKELDRLHFLCIIYTTLAAFIDQEGEKRMRSKFAGIWGAMESGKGNDRDAMQFASQCISGIIAASQQLVAI